MSVRVVRGISIFFFLALILAIVASFFVLRMKQSQTAAESFQSLIATSEDFSKTFATADLGSRNRLSQNIFQSLDNSRADAALVKNLKGEKQLAWSRENTAVSADENLSNSLFSQTISSSLAGLGTLYVHYQLVNLDDTRLVLIAALIALSGYAVILLFTAAMTGSSKKNQNEPSVSNEDAKSEQQTAPQKRAARHERPEPVAPQFETTAADRSPQQSTGEQIPQRPRPEPEIAETVADETEQEEQYVGHEKKEKDSKFILLDRNTGVSQQKFLPFRLDKELERSAENTVDLSFAIIRFPNIGELFHGEAAALVLQEFNHEDLIFDYEKDAFCVILTEHDLDQAIARMELFIRKVDQKFTGMVLNANSDVPDERRIIRATAGLTSRNGRIVDAKRFLREANVALKKANHEEGRIVGFRPDPLKFRHYLRHQRI